MALLPSNSHPKGEQYGHSAEMLFFLKTMQTLPSTGLLTAGIFLRDKHIQDPE
jgi:hypothetical protein